MKKIVDGKLYNTETATELGAWDNGFYGNDFKRCAEVLYKTGKGSFFLFGYGGPMSKYAQPCGNMTGGGEDITPLTKDEAYRWAEEHLSAEKTADIFPDNIEEA